MLSSENKYLSCKHFQDLSSYDHLTELNLSNLQLIKIDSFPFEKFPHLNSLNLSSNQLTFINPDWSKSFENSIKYLNLSHNQLNTLLFLKDFQHLKTLNITKNSLQNNERFLSLYICPTIEHLIDNDQEQIHRDQLKLDQLLYLIETKNDYLCNDYSQSIIKLIEKFEIFSEFHLSPLGNYCLEKINISQSKQTFKTYLTEDFKCSIDLNESSKNIFQPIKFFHSHQQSNDDLLNVSVHMCAFEPNSSKNILATCGGQKVCFIDCDTCEITHLFEVSILPSIKISINRKTKNKIINKEYFSCLCWMEIEDLKILAVGATNGFIYLLSQKYKLMFGHIPLPTSSVSCLTWHVSNPFTLIIGSNHTVRFINIRSYIDRLQSFIRKQNKLSTTQFDYVDSTMFIDKISTTHIYNLYDGVGPLIHITDLLFYSLSKTNLLLLVATNSGLFVTKHEEQSPIQLAFPKSIWTISEYVESLTLINQSSHLIAMNILHLDQIYIFNLEQSLKYQQLHIIQTISNPSRQIPTKMAIFSKTPPTNDNNSFECIIGSNHGSFYYHQIQSSEKTQSSEISFSETEPVNILSASLNEHYLCLTTNNNLICVYKRE